MKEMNNEMELNMEELEQVNGGGIVCVGEGATGPCYFIAQYDEAELCGYYARAGEQPPMNYCEMGVSLPDINRPNFDIS